MTRQIRSMIEIEIVKVVGKIDELSKAVSHFAIHDPELSNSLNKLVVNPLKRTLSALEDAKKLLEAAPDYPDMPLATEHRAAHERILKRSTPRTEEERKYYAKLERSALPLLALAILGVHPVSFGQLKATAEVLKLNGRPKLQRALERHPDLEALLAAGEAAERLT